MKTFLKAKPKKLDRQTKIEKYRVTALNIYIIWFQSKTTLFGHTYIFSFEYRDAVFIVINLIFLKIMLSKKWG